ncbi:MAG TPA: hypothetical protein VFI24_20845 [Pyrinomonadaceae bacterium]|nr:hypothetical protein [Pyrinomonadaceae bacterium]
MNQRKKISATQAVQMKAARKPPAAPPVYRPQPVPKVLQRKLACSVTAPPKSSTDAPKSPPVYRPNKTPLVMQTNRPVVQAKFATPVKGVPVSRTRFGVIQRAMAAAAYEEDRNAGDIGEGQKNFKTIKKSIAETAEMGPAGRFRLHTVEFNALPDKVKDAIREIVAGDDPADCYETYRGDFHCNRGGHIPETAAPQVMTQKQQNYHRDAQTKPTDKAGNVAQYAEFHVTQSGLGKAFRLLYDYVNDQFYISITHYNIWSDGGGGERNPFFRVVNVH